jgi:hypothetical protein
VPESPRSPNRDKRVGLAYTAVMQSPFPGMDPYLEPRWGDVHQRLITYAADQLGLQLPDDLRARVEERVYVETEADQVRRIVPDLHVAQGQASRIGKAISRGLRTSRSLRKTRWTNCAGRKAEVAGLS